MHISILQSSIKTRHGQEHGAKAVEQFQFYKVRLKQERARRHLRTGDGISILQSSIKTLEEFRSLNAQTDFNSTKFD